MKPSQKDKIVLSQTQANWVAAFVATLALFVSIASLYEAHEARVSSVLDDLVVHAHPPTGDQPAHVNKGGPPGFGSISEPWDIVISNTGSSTASVTEYEVIQIDGENHIQSYTGLDGGLFSPENNQPISLPIALEAGKSIRLLAVLGLNPGPKAYAVINDFMRGNKSTPSRHEIDAILAQRNLDLYDNPVSPMISDGKVIGWTVEKMGKEQTFLFKFKTARGVTIFDVSSWYPFLSQSQKN